VRVSTDVTGPGNGAFLMHRSKCATFRAAPCFLLGFVPHNVSADFFRKFAVIRQIHA
jgi:hypothetical protein